MERRFPNRPAPGRRSALRSAAFTPLQRPNGERSWMNSSRLEQITLKRAEARAPSESVRILPARVSAWLAVSIRFARRVGLRHFLPDL